MKNFFLKVRIISEFIIAFGLGYFTFTLSLPTFPTVVMGFLAVFFFFQTLGLIDKLNGYGQYHTDPKPEHHHEDHPHYGEPEDEEPIDDTDIEDESSDDDMFLSDDDDDIFINGSDY